MIEYRGTNYAGMQRQQGLRTVQGVLEEAVARFTGGETTTIDYCGRTDAGVHAFGQVVHFDVANRTEAQVLKGVNYFLTTASEEVSLKTLEKVPSGFHSRFSCVGREYRYYIYNGSTRSPIFWEGTHHVPQKLDLVAMQMAANLLLGEHDFSSFRGAGCQALSPIKTVDFLTIKHTLPEMIEVHIGAKSFLYRMVRNITGLLIWVGLGKLSVKEVQKIIDTRNNRALPYTAPACGLYFWKASY